MKYRETKGYKYLLVEDEKREVDIYINCHNDYISLDEGVLIIKEGYAWDGSSIPLKKYMPKWIWDSDKYCKIASLVHDALCQLMREGLLPKTYKYIADAIYQRMCIEGGMGKRQAGWRFWALRKFGNAGIKKEKNPRGQILTALYLLFG